MGDRCIKTRKGIIIDLDGTLISTNTFKQYIIFACKKAVGRWRFDIALNIIVNVGLRKLRLISHSVMKYRILSATTTLMNRQSHINQLVENLIAKANPTVVDIIQQCNSDNLFVCLATAAPSSYASQIADYFGMNACCATSINVNSDWRENVGEEKLKNVIDCSKKHNIDFTIVVTDHYDDLPLLKWNKDENILISPSDKTLTELRKQNIKFSIKK